MLVFEWKERAFIEKVNFRCFCWFPAAILELDQNGTPIWRLHKVRETFRQKNSETVGHKNLRQIVYILVFYNISFSWLLPLDGFQFFFCYVTVKTIYRFFGDKIWEEKCHTYRQSRLLHMEYVYGRVRHSPDRLDVAQQITTNFTKTSVYFKIFIHHIYS